MPRRLWATESYADYLSTFTANAGRGRSTVSMPDSGGISTPTRQPLDILAISFRHKNIHTLAEALPCTTWGNIPTTGYCSGIQRRPSEPVRAGTGQDTAVWRRVFGVSLAKSPNSDSNFELDNKVGACISKGLRSGITGNPAELIVIDDPIKDALEANSTVFRDRVWDEWIHAIRTRLAPGAKAIVISTRWHEDDIIGRMLVAEGRYDAGGTVQYINIPCEAEENDPRAVNRRTTFPEIADREWLAKTKQAL